MNVYTKQKQTHRKQICGYQTRGVGLGIWIQVLALCMSTVINSLVIFCVCMHAKSLQLCLTLCDPIDHTLPGSSCPWDSPGKNTGVCCHALLQGISLTQGSNLHLLCLLH